MRVERLCCVLWLTMLMSTATIAGQAQVLSPNLLFTSLQPCRLIDTRLVGGPLAPGEPRTFNIVGVEAAGSLAGQGGNPNGCPVPGYFVFMGSSSPPRVQAVLLNVVAVGPAGPGDLRAWPTDRAAPNASILNYSSVPGLNLANAVVLPVRQDQQGGDITLQADISGTHVVADVLGYFSADSDSVAENVAIGLGASGGSLVGPGSFNTSMGHFALVSNTNGSNNTVVGNRALFFATGSSNTAMGSSALVLFGSGDANTAIGVFAMLNFAAGDRNTGIGSYAMGNPGGSPGSAIGSENTGLGYEALGNLASGSNNLALGSQAGLGLSTGSNNVYVANPGAQGDSGAIRIGTDGTHTSASIAGISGATSSSGVSVLIDGTGKLGTTTSSRRFKEDIRDLGEESRNLLRLRPVSFVYRPEYDDGSRRRQYGLIAEEVAEVYPELVVNGDDGQPQAVRYQLLAPLLLAELERQDRQLGEQKERAAGQEKALNEDRQALRATRRQIEDQARTIAAQADLLKALMARISALERGKNADR